MNKKCSDCRWFVPKHDGHAALCDHPQTRVSMGNLGAMRQTVTSARWDAATDSVHKCGSSARFFEPRSADVPETDGRE
jgi:hypothetical protein